MNCFMFRLVTFVILAGMAETAFAESFIFVNETDKQVDYVLLHHDENIRSAGSVGPQARKSHNNLRGFGKRAIVVWSKDGELLYAGSGAEFQKGLNMFLTFKLRDPNTAGDFEYTVNAAFSSK